MGKSDQDFLSALLHGVSSNQRNPEYEAIANGENRQFDHQRTGLSQPIAELQAETHKVTFKVLASVIKASHPDRGND